MRIFLRRDLIGVKKIQHITDQCYEIITPIMKLEFTPLTVPRYTSILVYRRKKLHAE